MGAPSSCTAYLLRYAAAASLQPGIDSILSRAALQRKHSSPLTCPLEWEWSTPKCFFPFPFTSVDLHIPQPPDCSASLAMYHSPSTPNFPLRLLCLWYSLVHAEHTDEW